METEKDIKELEARISESDYQYAQMQKLYNQVKQENKQHQIANQELLDEMIAASAETPLAGQPEQNPVAIPPRKIIQLKHRSEEIKEKTREEKVIEALEAGMSLAEAGKLAGCSKSTAYNIKKSTYRIHKSKKIEQK